MTVQAAMFAYFAWLVLITAFEVIRDARSDRLMKRGEDK